MKKIFSVLSLCLGTATLYAQSDTTLHQWNTIGNEADTNSFVGTVNAVPLKFKTNNTDRLTISESGNVGVGTMNPEEKLDVDGSIRGREDLRVDGNFSVGGESDFTGNAVVNGQFKIGTVLPFTDGNNDIIVRGDDGILKKFPLAEMADFMYLPRLCGEGSTPTWQSVFVPSQGNDAEYGKLYTNCASRVGILTDNPLHPLDVNGHGQFRSSVSINHRLSVGAEISNFARFMVKNTSGGASIQVDQKDNTNPYTKLLFLEYTEPTTEIIHVSGPNHTPLLIDVAGNMKISSPTREVFRVDANAQTVFARKIVVDEEVWPDYVFAPEYKLRTLQEVKQFIDENGHLPNVPSQETVMNEGVDLGGMVNVLLEKVEELTLYTIQQQEEIEQLKEQLKAQQAAQE